MSERKYRQRGYQEDATDSRRSVSQPRGAEARDAPRGRGLGRPEREVFRCRDCGREAQLEVVHESVCGQCGASLRACVNCRSFDPSARWECRADIAERVRSKTRGNDCPRFQPKTTLELGDERKPTDPKAAFDALFR
jgi:hypothetical protein